LDPRGVLVSGGLNKEWKRQAEKQKSQKNAVLAAANELHGFGRDTGAKKKPK